MGRKFPKVRNPRDSLCKGKFLFNKNTTESSCTVLDRTTTKGYTSLGRERIDSKMGVELPCSWQVESPAKDRTPCRPAYIMRSKTSNLKSRNPPTGLIAIYTYWSLWIRSRLMRNKKAEYRLRQEGLSLKAARSCIEHLEATDPDNPLLCRGQVYANSHANLALGDALLELMHSEEFKGFRRLV